MYIYLSDFLFFPFFLGREQFCFLPIIFGLYFKGKKKKATMPGPKMGPRPTDFDEDVIRQSPTFIKWAHLEPGQVLRYACREFVKGHEDDEERLMRRIMIARRNNIRDHTVLKQARAKRNPLKKRHRTAAATVSDEQVAGEMDTPAVEATRSYRAWMELKDGEEFVVRWTLSLASFASSIVNLMKQF